MRAIAAYAKWAVGLAFEVQIRVRGSDYGSRFRSGIEVQTSGIEVQIRFRGSD